MLSTKRFAEVFPPGDFISEELAERGWSQIELAEIIGRAPRVVSEIITGKRSLTPETAKALGDAFGTGAQYWMNLESAYQLWRAQDVDQAIARRAHLYQMAPVKEITKRHWIEPSENVEVLEQRVLEFLGLKSVDEKPPHLAHAARKSTSYSDMTPSQYAWLCRARQLAPAVTAQPFTKASFDKGMGQLTALLGSIEGVRLVPRVLADMGIRFILLEALPQTRIDGVCFWLDKVPVIVLTLRFDRIDAFWHTLAHELYHVKNRDGLTDTPNLDTDLIREIGGQSADQDCPENEKHATHFATEFTVDAAELKHFINRTAPLYSALKILRFANRIKVHPGLVVGQLQFRGEIPYSHHRRMLEKVRHLAMQTALADGWGQVPTGL